MTNKILKIILTDDDQDDRVFFKEAIEDLGMQTQLTLLNHGQELMDHLNKEEQLLPDLLFLDLNMPIKNGMECLKEIRQTSQLNDIIIAIYSTSNLEADIEEAFVNGANIYIHKPDSFGELKKIIQKVLKINWQYHTSHLNKENFLLKL